MKKKNKSKKTIADVLEEKIKENEEKDKKEEQEGIKIKKIEKKQPKNQIIIPLLIQFILSIITLICLIIYFINKNTIVLLQISLSTTMLVTGYNNYTVYKRKIFTYIYFIVGLLLLSLAILTIIGY